MYPRTDYEMTQADLDQLMEASRRAPAIMIGGYMPSQQENANNAWTALGQKMGFDPMTVRPIDGKGNRFFSAVPSENVAQKKERIAREKAAVLAMEISELESSIAADVEKLNKLKLKASDPEVEEWKRNTL